MPASAVIPAPIVYTNIAAVKKLVVKVGPWLGTKARGARAVLGPGGDSWDWRGRAALVAGVTVLTG